jgi:hypothetical protein
MRKKFAAFSLALLVTAFAANALAQATPPANPNPPQLVAWSLLASALMTALLKALSPGNAALPAELSPKVLHVINVAGGLLTTGLLGIEGGTPWPQAIVAGLLPFVVGLVQVGAAKGTWLAILESALMPLQRKAVAAKKLGLPVPTPPAAS